MAGQTPLPDFIEGHIEDILEDWSEFATRQLGAGSLDAARLRITAEKLLRALAADLRARQAAKPSNDREQDRAPRIAATARRHAATRLSDGFTLDQVVSEYRILRNSVGRRWGASVEVDAAGLDELTLFSDAVDQSLTEAVRSFNDGLQRARDLFVGMLGHDLRDPLYAIANAAQLQVVTRDSATIFRSAERILASSQRMSGMITDILDFARTRLGERLPIVSELVDLGACCRYIAEELELSNRPRRIELSCRDGLIGFWDPDRIKQLLANLISNALEYGDPRYPVVVMANARGDDVLISVHNMGNPIPPERHRAIFDPLMRGNEPEPRVPRKGMGLGLYIVQEIALAHGGDVSVTSSDEEGTTFFVRLPRATSKPASATEASSAS